jgi:hypothetical protein
MLSFSISYSDIIKFHYFAYTTERGDKGWKQRVWGVKEGVTLEITLLSPPSSLIWECWHLGILPYTFQFISGQLWMGLVVISSSVTFGYHRTLPTLTISICFSKLLKFSPKQIPRTNFCQRKKESSRIKLFFYGFWHGKLIKSLKFAPFWEKKGSNHHIQTKCARKLSV